MAAGVGPAKEPKRRLKMKEMVGGVVGAKETRGSGFFFLYREEARRIGNCWIRDRSGRIPGWTGRLRDLVNRADDVR